MTQSNKIIDVLLVDDSDMVRERVVTALSALDGLGAIRQASTTEAARLLMAEQNPDIVILDVDLAGKNGIDLLPFVDRRSKQPMVIILSNYDHPRLRMRCLELGANYYCHKTIEFDKFVKLVEAFVQRRQPSPKPEAQINSELLEAARSFRDREERYRAIFDRSMDCLFVLDLNGRVLDANPAALALLGHSWMDIPTLTLATLLDEEQVCQARIAIAEVIRTGTLRETIEFTVRRKDGGKVTVDVKASLIVRDGKPYAIQGIARDTTDRKRAEAELAAREEVYRVVLRATGQIVYDYNLATGAMTWNGAIDEVLGDPWEEMQRVTMSNWKERIHPDDRERVEAVLAKAIKRQDRYLLEYRVKRKDGTFVFVEERGTFFTAGDGQSHRVLATISNITERKSIEEHIREQARLLDLAHDAILVLDLEDNILYWNSSAERIYGWTAEQALGRKAAELLNQDAAITAEVRNSVMEKEDWTGELTHLTRLGQKVLVEARLTLVRDPAGNPKSILSINTDITERKRLEAQFLRTQRMESIGTLASGVAHDLNNVLAPIMMATQLLEGDPPAEDRKHLHALDSFQRGTRRRPRSPGGRLLPRRGRPPDQAASWQRDS